MPTQPQHRVGNHGRAAPARGAVDEYSRLRLIVAVRARRSKPPPPISRAAAADRDPASARARPARDRRPPARPPDPRPTTRPARGRQLTTCVTPCSARPATAWAGGTPLIAMRSSPIQFSGGLTASGPGTPRGRGRTARTLRRISMPASGITVIRPRRPVLARPVPGTGGKDTCHCRHPQSRSVRRCREPPRRVLSGRASCARCAASDLSPRRAAAFAVGGCLTGRRHRTLAAITTLDALRTSLPIARRPPSGGAMYCVSLNVNTFYAQTPTPACSRLEPPVPRLPLVRLDVTTHIGRVHLRHPGAQRPLDTARSYAAWLRYPHSGQVYVQ